MFKRIIGLVIAFVLTFPMLAAAEEEVKKKLTIALIPEENIFAQRARYRPLFKYLSENLNMEVVMRSLPSYGNLADEFLTPKVDAAFPGKLTYLLTRAKDSIEPIVRPVHMDGISADRAYLLVRKDSGIKSIADMKGKTLALVHHASLCGYLYPRQYFKEKGIYKMDAYFKRIIFTGSHDAVVMAVFGREADIGFAGEDVYRRLIKENPELRIEEAMADLHKSPPFTTDGFVVKIDMEPTLKKRLKHLFLGLDKNDEGREILDNLGFKRFIETGNKDYEPLFQLMEKWGIDLETYHY